MGNDIGGSCFTGLTSFNSKYSPIPTLENSDGELFYDSADSSLIRESAIS